MCLNVRILLVFLHKMSLIQLFICIFLLLLRETFSDRFTKIKVAKVTLYSIPTNHKCLNVCSSLTLENMALGCTKPGEAL